MANITDKIYRLINAQNILKNNLRQALLDAGVSVDQDLLLKDYPNLIAQLKLQQNNNSQSTEFNSTVLAIKNAGQGGAVGSGITINVSDMDRDQIENSEFDPTEIKK